MKVSKEKLKQMIKEELEKVMKETEQFPTKADKKLRQRGPSPSNQFGDNTDHYTGPEATAADREWAEKNKADIAKRRAEMDAEERKKFKKGMERDAKKTGNRLGEEVELEEIKGAAGSALAAMDKGRDLSRNTSNVKMTVNDVAYGSDEPVVGDWEDSDHIPPASKEEVISSTLERLGIEPESELGMDIAAQLRSAAEKVRSRTAVRHSNNDRLASRERAMADDEPVKSGPRKGMRSISTNKALKRNIKAGLGLEESEELDEVKAHGGAEEKGEHKGETKAEKAEHDKKKMEEAQLEELRESFRRFTKLPKNTLKD